MDYISLGGDSSPLNYEDYNGWYSNLKVVFHTALADNQSDLTDAIISRIDADFDVTNTNDPEVLQRWFPLTIRLVTYSPVYSKAEAWVGSLGRLKYLTPVYTAL